MVGGQDSALPTTVSALANGLDRRQAFSQNSTLGVRVPYHVGSKSLIHDFLLSGKGFLRTVCSVIGALRHLGSAV